MATIKEVAAHAGVTPTTVTNVLRGRGKTSEATRQRVLDAVALMGYRPNLTARALVEGKAPTFALMLSCITNPFYPEFMLHVGQAALRQGRYLIVCNTDYELDDKTRFLNAVAGSLSDGILVANNPNIDFDQLKRVGEQGVPVVLDFWEDPDTHPGIPCLAFDGRRAGRMATEHLLELGHKKIGAIIASPKNGIHNMRYKGFRESMRAARTSCPAGAVRYCEDTFEGGKEAALALLSAMPELTAVFVSNDLAALGVLEAAAELGRTLPDDLSVASITDIMLASQARPSLTTVAIPTARMAERGIELLIELQAGKHAAPPMERIDDLRLVVRASTARLPA
ncbi:LacI family DNA-binding transcriptional regulator [Pseudoduganella sp. LjRoot289]|uniref:LacI family DNA-binding transcriptional regulator n=1 Tax=Pseudoduganella sp. LjRoot289 TaxID=3342314 RepID=UPI003ECFFA8E